MCRSVGDCKCRLDVFAFVFSTLFMGVFSFYYVLTLPQTFFNQSAIGTFRLKVNKVQRLG